MIGPYFIARLFDCLSPQFQSCGSAFSIERTCKRAKHSQKKNIPGFSNSLVLWLWYSQSSWNSSCQTTREAHVGPLHFWCLEVLGWLGSKSLEPPWTPQEAFKRVAFSFQRSLPKGLCKLKVPAGNVGTTGPKHKLQKTINIIKARG